MVLGEGPTAHATPPRYLWPTIFFGFIGGAFIYWAVIRSIARISKNSPLKIRIVKSVQGGNTGTEAILAALKQAKLEGNNWIVVYELHGRAAKTRNWIVVKLYRLYEVVAR